MPLLFVGGEEGELNRIGNGSVDTTTTAARRGAYARCSLSAQLGALTDGWQGRLTTPSSEFWLTTRAYWPGPTGSSGSNFSSHVISLIDGMTRRLVLTPTSESLVSSRWSLAKINAAGTVTTLVISSTNCPAAGVLLPNSPIKVDVYVRYGLAGAVKIYLDQILIIDFAGDVTTDGATSLSGFSLGCLSNNANQPDYKYSEIIASTTDTRGLSLATLPPLAAGNSSAWTGTASDVNETALADATLIASATANQLSEFTVTKPTAIAGNLGVAALVVNARAQKGAGGPQSLQLAVRTGAVDYFSATQPLGVSFAPAQGIFELNPATAQPWTTADLTAAGFNIGVKSIA